MVNPMPKKTAIRNILRIAARQSKNYLNQKVPFLKCQEFFLSTPEGLFDPGELDPLELASFDPNEYHIPFA